MRFWGGMLLGVVAFLSPATPNAASLLPLKQLYLDNTTTERSAAVSSSARVVPVVAFGKDSRQSPEAFASEHHLDLDELRSAHSASGLIQCGDAHGAGQLTLSSNVVTTAAHVFFDENGIRRSATCTFDVYAAGQLQHVPINLASIVAGSTNPYAVAPAHDWAVAKLMRHVPDARPYGIASDIHANEVTTFIARGHIDWGEAKRLSMEECLMHDQLSAAEEGTREFSFDCETGDGASGGALMFDKTRTQIGAILVGWRSNHPFKATPFSRTHYNFAVTMEGAFRKAVFAAAGNVLVQK
jgi:hypothetical protein